MSAVMAPPAPTIGVQRSLRTDERGPGFVPCCRLLRATGLAIPATACSWSVLPPLRLLTGRRNRRDGGARPALAGHLELAYLQRADLDLPDPQFPDHRIRDRKPADGDRADRGDGESEGTHRRRPEDAGADSHRAGGAHRRGGGAASLVTDADDAGHGASCGWPAGRRRQPLRLLTHVATHRWMTSGCCSPTSGVAPCDGGAVRCLQESCC